MSKSQDIYERVEALAAEGHSKKEAQAMVAKEAGLKPSSVRGLCYKARKANGQTGRRRVRETTTEGAVASAVETLENARKAIDEEIDHAKERAEEGRRELQALQGSAKARKAEIETKIEALTS